MAKPNYSFEKRQRELAKKKKKEVKEKERADRKAGAPGSGDASTDQGAAIDSEAPSTPPTTEPAR